MTTLSIIIVEPNAILGEGLKHLLEHKGFTIAGVVDSARAVATLNGATDETTILLNGARGDIVADFTLLKAVRSNARIIVYGGRSELKATLEAIQSGATVYLDDKVNATMFLKSLEMAADGFVTMSVTVRGEPGQVAIGRQAAVVEAPPLAPEAAATPALDAASAPVSAPLALPATSSGMTPAMQRTQYTPEALALRRATPPLSPREASILQLLREGAPNKLIARQLSLTEATVKVHLKSILRKIRVNNRTQAAVWAMEQDALFAAQVNGRAE